jgi:hypothetical protein
MTRQQHWEKMLPLIEAFVSGKEVEWHSEITGWQRLESPGFDLPHDRYRIAPKPRKVWVNEYPGFPANRCFCFHETKEQADNDAGNNRIACHEIELPPLP